MGVKSLHVTNCRVFQGTRTPARSLLAVGNRIHSLDPAEVPQDAEVLDLGGKWLFPAFVDAHVHLTDYANRLSEINLERVGSLEDALELVRTHIVTVNPPAGQWIRGGGWKANNWRYPPTRQALDKVAPRNPVLLTCKDEHAAWANSLAIKRADLDCRNPLPRGAVAEKDDQGEFTGVFKEAALPILKSAVPNLTSEEIEARILKAFSRLHSLGVTALGDVGPLATLDSLRHIKETNRLNLRVFKMVPLESLQSALEMGLSMGDGDDLLRVGNIKMFADGSLTSKTAYLLEPYEGSPGYRGIEVMSREELRHSVRASAEAGFATAIHAIGDAAIRDTLDTLEEYRGASSAQGLRHRIEHSQLVNPRDFDHFRCLEVIASVQPSHIISDHDLADRHWGERSRYAYPLRSLIESGTTLAFGSDAPVEEPDPVIALSAAVTRGESHWYPEECIGIQEALTAHTRGAAIACCWDGLGRLEPGMLADMVAVSGNPFLQQEGITEMRVECTVVGGEVVNGWPTRK